MPGHAHAHAARRVLGVFFTVRPLRQSGTFLAFLLELIQSQMNNSRRACLSSANHFKKSAKGFHYLPCLVGLVEFLVPPIDPELRCTAFNHTAPLADDMSPYVLFV